MKKIILQALVTLGLLTLAVKLNAQVSIGSLRPPATGAILDLKEDVTLSNNATSTRGLGLPCVQLISITIPNTQTLAQTIQGNKPTDRWDAEAHIGLLVYNVGNTTIKQGAYVWNGQKWQSLDLEDENLPDTYLNSNYFDLSSGFKSTPDPQILEIRIGKTGNLKYTANHTLGGGVLFSGINVLPSSPLSSNEEQITLLPDAMTINPNAPWQSKETVLKFTNPQSTSELLVTLNQTHYALKVDGGFTDSYSMLNNGKTGNIQVQGNATWEAKINTSNNALIATSPIAGGATIKDYPNKPLNTTSFNYSFNPTKKYDYAEVTFEDDKSPKRFQDITVSMAYCNDDDAEPTLDEWAIRAGFTQEEINSIPSIGGVLKDTNDVPITRPNGVQLHKDQNGNIFLSGDFGSTAGRWMLNNLAATTFEGGSGLLETEGEDSNKPEYYYPNKDKNTFLKNKRMGLLYNWHAATGGRGAGASSGSKIDEGEDTGFVSTNNRGICPKGWHLPTDLEWTKLELEINANTSLYSSMDDINDNSLAIGTITRGSHGTAMKDPCANPSATNDPSGKSKIILSKNKPGLNIMLAGLSWKKYTTVELEYGDRGYFWTASNATEEGAWCRSILRTTNQVYRSGGNGKGNLFSVRCKQD